MPTQNTFNPTDLVLRVSGGRRDGELIPVETRKCYLEFQAGPGAGNQRSQCAIFRGPQGAAVRSYASGITVNGTGATVHWLKPGDQIEIADSIAIEVSQIGTEAHQANRFRAGQETNFEETSQPELNLAIDELGGLEKQMPEPSASERSAETHVFEAQDFVNLDVAAEGEVCDEDPAADPCSSTRPTDELKKQMLQVETQIREILLQDRVSQASFEQLHKRLGDLCAQIFNMTHPTHPGTDVCGDLPAAGPITDGQPPAGTTSDDQRGAAEGVDALDGNPVSDLASHRKYDLESDFYSFLQNDSDDEQMVAFDPEEDSDSEANSDQTMEVVDHADVAEGQAESTEPMQAEVDARLAEMEVVFGGPLSELKNQAELPDATVEEFSALAGEGDPRADELEIFSAGQDNGSASIATPSANDENESLDSHAPGNSGVDSLGSTSPQANQLLEDVESSLPPVAEETVAEADSAQPTRKPEGDPPRNESVAELLARMQSEGQWSGIPGEEGVVVPEEPINDPQTVASEQPVHDANEGHDVEDYMSQLLNRMRGGETELPSPVVKPEPSKSEKQPEDELVLTPENPLKAEEFVPQRKAKQIESFDAMRELANSSARSAVKKSEEGRRKTLGHLQVGIAVASFVMAVYYLLIASTELLDVSFCFGLVCTGISGFLGYRFYMTIKHNELIERLSEDDNTIASTDETIETSETIEASEMSQTL